jgi:hypothetical protein
MKILIPIDKIDSIATKNDFNRIDYQEKIGLISYSDGDTRINIYLSKMTVSTCLNHPKKGKTQLFRKNVNINMLSEIFEYPRKHTGKGYYTKNK